MSYGFYLHERTPIKLYNKKNINEKTFDKLRKIYLSNK